jgi:hypothetical protein
MPEFGLSLYQQPSGNDLRAGLLTLRQEGKAVDLLEN